jgi:hypothetical protein
VLPDSTLLTLRYLDVEPAAADSDLLDRLVAAYVRRVPWESVSRIAAKYAGMGSFPRWPDTFWQQALAAGTGGTCFESNYAFIALLHALGYEGYLTINNMGDTIGCHTAIVVRLGADRWLVDVGLPLYVPLPLDAQRVTRRDSPLQRYTVRPLDDYHYEIEREPHPKQVAFTLIDRAVDEVSYRAATTADYGSGGLFLNRVIINKVIDGRLWRFASSDTPYLLEAFSALPDSARSEYPITEDTAAVLAAHFGMDKALLRAALRAVQA